MKDSFGTESHARELDIIYGIQPADFKEEYSKTCKSFNHFKTEWRFIRKFFSSLFRKTQKNNDFKTILYLTLDYPPLDFISAFRKQYPDKDIKVLIPIDNKNETEKLIYGFEYYLQNRMNSASLYKMKQNSLNIDVYGLYSEAFSGSDRTRLQYLAPFIKASRIASCKLKPEVIHADNIPFYLGAEFEKKSHYPIKVLQIIHDFSRFEADKKEAFWAAINLVDSNGMKKLCRDKIIKKCIASLFNLHNTKCFCQMRECLDFIYQNYYKLRKYPEKCDDIDENILFNRLNSRILKLFPKMEYENDLYYNTIFHTLKRADFWAVPSKTYYNSILTKPELSGKMFDRICKTKNKSSYISYGYEIPQAVIYKPFTEDDFREARIRNKKYLTREFSKDRIRTRFIDPKFFKSEEYTIKGYLAPFFDTPLIFCKLSADIFTDGTDIALTSIIKLLEEFKNIQAIVNIPNGLENNQIKNWVEFLEEHIGYSGKWLFIDGEINLAQFYASSDLAFFCARNNITTSNHFTAMKYGCVPVALRQGIYNDTISDIFDDMTFGCGFKTKTPVNTEEDIIESFNTAVTKALKLYTQNPASWKLLIKNAINYNAGWTFDKIEKFNRIYSAL